MSADQQPSPTSAPIRLYDEATGTLLMEITPDQLQRLQDALEEEFLEDHDYYISWDTLDYLFDRRVDAEIVDCLRQAIGPREGFDLLWHAGDR